MSNSALTFNSTNFLPSGLIFPYAGNAVPAGFLECDGSEVNQADYPLLYATIQNTYNTQINPITGVAYGTPAAGKFRLPDYRGSFLRGIGTPTGKDPVTLGGHQAEKTAKNGLSNTSSALTGSAVTSGNNSTYTNFDWQDYAWEGVGSKTGFAGGRSASGAGGTPMNLGSFGGTHTLSNCCRYSCCSNYHRRQ